MIFNIAEDEFYQSAIGKSFVALLQQEAEEQQEF
jgi:hypothetical protein